MQEGGRLINSSLFDLDAAAATAANHLREVPRRLGRDRRGQSAPGDALDVPLFFCDVQFFERYHHFIVS